MDFVHNSCLVGVFDATHDNAVFIATRDITWYCAPLAQTKTMTCVDIDEKAYIAKAAILEQGDDIRIVLVCAVRNESDLVRFTEVIYIDPRSDSLVSRKPFPNEGCRYKIGMGRFVSMVKSKSGTAVFVTNKCSFDMPDLKSGMYPSFAIFEATFDDFVVRVFDSTLAMNGPVIDTNQYIKSIDLEANRAIVWVGGVVGSQLYTKAGTFVPATQYDLSVSDDLAAIDPESGCCVRVPRGSVDAYMHTTLDVTPTVSYEHAETFDVGVPLYTTSRNAVFIRGRLWFTTFDKTTNVIRYRDFGSDADTKPCV